MVFSSLLFLFRFLPLVLILYFLSPRGARNAVLFFVSLFFYAWGEPVYVLLMLFSTVVDYIHGRMTAAFKEKGMEWQARLTVASSVMINLGLLCLFKYTRMLPLPIGISFYTFQTMSYTIDIYRGDAKVQKNILSFGAYVAMFPQLIAGPIVQYKTISEELSGRKETAEGFSEGIHLFVTGLGKKVLFANNIGILWESISSMASAEIPVLLAWMGIFAYAFQIYFDFSGYSDMARGLGKMFGFSFPLNFDYPYCSKSITEFWRRWHISLGTWFREYVYIPLGGNRRGLPRQLINILIVWLLTGIWHGAGWNFLLWGLYYACFLIVEKIFLLRLLKKAPAWIGHLYSMSVVLFGWVLFAFDELERGIAYMTAMLGFAGNGFINRDACYILMNNIVLFALLASAAFGMWKKAGSRMCVWMSGNDIAFWAWNNAFYVFIMVMVTAYLVNSSYNPFLYFRF